jgi:polyphosphate kinase
MIAHLISTVPYHEVQRVPLELPPRPLSNGYRRIPREMQTHVPDHADTLVGQPAREPARKPAGKSAGKSAAKRSRKVAPVGTE